MRIDDLLKRAYAGREKMDKACNEIAKMLQPFFAEEITVEHQPGDGFVVVWQDDIFQAPRNVPVTDAAEMLRGNPDYFKESA